MLSLSISLRQGLSLHQKLTISARLAGYCALGTHLYLPLSAEVTGMCSVQSYSAFYLGAGYLNSGPHTGRNRCSCPWSLFSWLTDLAVLLYSLYLAFKEDHLGKNVWVFFHLFSNNLYWNHSSWKLCDSCAYWLSMLHQLQSPSQILKLQLATFKLCHDF